MGSLVSKGYGDALFELGKELNQLKDFKAQGELVRKTLNEDLMRVLTHPKISKFEKKACIETIYKESVHPVFLNTMKYMIDKNRFRYFVDALNEFDKNYNEHFKITIAKISSAKECSADEKNRIQSMLEKKLTRTVECQWSIDESLLAGLRIKINDQILDNSAANRLHRLKEEVVNTALK